MRKQYPVPAETRDLQARASDPKHSAWVSANAGSGKTHVLSQRVIRLLLDGADPSRVLCLTYTRAAAANMSNRVFESLAKWAMLDDDDLADRIVEVEGRRPDRERLKRARELFARALETPGGLKIQTIHAFCESILHQFPLEANIAAHFEMLDPLMEEALFAAARREMLTGAMAQNAPGLPEAFAMVLERGGEAGLDELLVEIVRKREGLRAFLDSIGVGDQHFVALFEEFDFQPGESAATIAASAWPLPGFDRRYFSAFALACDDVGAARARDGIVPDAGRGMVESDPERRLSLLAGGFLKKDGEPYSPSWVFSKALLGRLPDLAERYSEASEALMATQDRLALFRTLEATRAALVLADALIARYEQLKAGRGYLDFNDLITRTVRLLARQDAGAWVHYKLDKGIDHILLDEAQDTSPHQWNVVTRLAEEFFAGSGARDNINRTIFAVGDEKQSIYSFQGAEPESFARTGWEFSERIKAALGRFERVILKLSFRSTEDVLGAVDRVFASDAASRGLSFEHLPIQHEAIRVGAPGYVELWPSIGDDAVDEPDDWTVAIDHAKAPAVRLAEHIAATVDQWIASGELVDTPGRKLKPGDVLVLVRKRGSFANALSRSLKVRGIAVAGADRLSLPGHIAVKDMMALGRCLIQPEDDLSLAAVLRSPIFGFSDEGLFAVAARRCHGMSLAASLRSQTDDACRAASARLDAWANEASFQRPFEFYSGVLGRDGIRQKMIGRLGQDAGDILDEFLNFCLAQEKTGLPGLEAFLATLETAAPDIKREMDQTRDEVRIMTVHAAKGLEAPVVFLVDSGSEPFHTSHVPRLLPFDRRDPLDAEPGYLWRAPGDVQSRFAKQIAAAIGDDADNEYRRLLYVGMTRAEDRLIVCGFHGKRPPKSTTWHEIVSGALKAAPETAQRAHPAAGEAAFRFRVTGDAPASMVAEVPDAVPAPSVPFPDALRIVLPPVRDLPRPLAPSGAAALLAEAAGAVISGRSPVFDPQAENSFAIARGLVTHKLLQMLPSLPETERADAASRYLERTAADWPEHERLATRDAVLAILEAPGFQPLFAPGSRAEISVAGTLDIRGEPRLVSGKIDRLAVSDAEVLIVDYKTNRPAPETLAAVPGDYVVQLALYRALIGGVYPGRNVSAALLFTDAPRLLAVPAEAMDAALARLAKA